MMVIIFAAQNCKGAVSNIWQDYGDRLLAEYARRLGAEPNRHKDA